MKKWSDGGLGGNWGGLEGSRGTPRTIRRHTNEVSHDLVLQDIRNPTFQRLCQHWGGHPTVIHLLFTSYSPLIPLLFTSYSHLIHLLFTSYSPLIHLLFTSYSHLIHFLFTSYSLVIHLLFTSYSPLIHLLFTLIHFLFTLIHILFDCRNQKRVSL